VRTGAGPEIIDEIFRRFDGLRGRALTEFLIATGNARDPAALRQVYEQNQDAIEAYLGEVRVEKLVRKGAGSVAGEAARETGRGTAFIGGAAVSFFLSQILS